MGADESELQLFRWYVSEACSSIGTAKFGEILREHGLREFLLNEEMEGWKPQNFFIFAVRELVLIGKDDNNCAIALGSLAHLRYRLKEEVDRWAPEMAEDLLRIVAKLGTSPSKAIEQELVDWVYYNYP
jgi:hypothetical protein